MQTSELIACHECDLLHRIRPLPENAVVRCFRCGAMLFHRKRNSLDRSLAFTAAGLIVFVLANVFPFLSLRMEGQVQDMTLLTGIRELYHQGMPGVAVLVLMTTLASPLIMLTGLLYVLLPLKLDRRLPAMLPVFRWVRHLQPWSMVEVFMLGILVSIVKLAKMAEIVPGISLYSFLALIFILAAVPASLDPQIVWEKWRPTR